MKRTLVSRDLHVILQVYKHIIRPHLEYCAQVWAPVAEHGNWATIMQIESVQRGVTKIIVGCEDLSYKERLDKLKMTTLLERRMRGDLIEAFKILNGFTDNGGSWFNISSRTGKLIINGTNNHKRHFC